MKKFLSLVCLILFVFSFCKVNFIPVTAAEIPVSTGSPIESTPSEEDLTIDDIWDVFSRLVSRGKLLIQSQKDRIPQVIRILSYTKIAQLILQ